MANKPTSNKNIKGKSNSPKRAIKKSNITSKSAKTSNKKAYKNNILIALGISLAIVIIFVVVVVAFVQSVKNDKANKLKEEEARYNALPVHVDISMNSYYGNIKPILLYFDLDYDEVKSGATCKTGVQKHEYHTEKYGLLHVEFSYCKNDKTESLRVYNSSADQELREPYEGEIATFDDYGEMVTNDIES